MPHQRIVGLRSGVCETRVVGPSGAVASLVLAVSFVTPQASGRFQRAFAMNRPGVHGGAGLAPAVGLIRRLSASRRDSSQTCRAVSLLQTGAYRTLRTE